MRALAVTSSTLSGAASSRNILQRAGMKDRGGQLLKQRKLEMSVCVCVCLFVCVYKG